MQEIVTGSISSGTTRSQDLIPAFLDALRDRDATAAQALEEEYCEVLDCIQGLGIGDVDEGAMYLFDALYDKLNELAPPFHYFGAHEGNGSDFGFWICDESIRESIGNADTVATTSLGTEYCINLDDGMLWHINDHGILAGWELSDVMYQRFPEMAELVLGTTPIVEDEV